MLATFSACQVFFPSITLKLCFQLPQNIRELTVSRKTAKNLAVRRQNEIILTVSRRKMLTVKKI